MSFSFKKFLQGIRIVPKSGSTASEAGDMEYDSSQDKLTIRNSSSVSPVVSESHTSQGTNRLKNKDLEDSSTAIVDSSDTTKKIKFDAAGTTGTSTTIAGSQTTDRTLTLPDATDTVAAVAATQTLTNKTLSGNTATNLVSGAGTFTFNTSGTVTAPNATDTLVGKNTTDTLTNKSIDGTTNTFSNIPNSATTATASATASTIVARDGSANTALNKAVVNTGAGNGLDVPSAGALEIGASVGANNITVGGGTSSVVIPGNLEVQGTTTSINSTNLDVEDANITVNFGGTDGSSEGAGLTIDRTGTSGSLIYKDASATKFALGALGSEVDIVGISSTQTLTNKTLTGNTAVNLVSGAGTLTLNTSGTATVPNATDTLVGKNTTDTLTNKTLTVPTIDIVNWDDQASTPSNPSAGFYKTYFKTDGKLYKLDSAGTEVEIGSGSGGINYIDNSDAEASTTGWATYADAAGSTPVNGTGGSPTVTFTRTTSSPLRGSASFLFTKDAANRQGEGASYDFTIDSADKAKILQITADYAIASGTFVTSDLTVYIYDVTNAVVIQPAGYSIQNLTTDLPGKINAIFQTASNSTSYRLIFHVASTSASAYTVKLDNVVVGPQIVEYGAPVTDWVSFTPTGSWTTNTTYAGKWRRNGDSMEIEYYLTVSGAPTATALNFNLPSGYSIDTTKLADPSASVDTYLPSTGGVLDTGVTTYPSLRARYGTTTNIVPIVHNGSSGGGAGISNTSPFTFASGDEIWLNVSVPISGWSSTVQMSNDTDTRVVAFRGSGTTTGSGAIKWRTTNSNNYDTHSAYSSSTGVYTCPVPGIYEVSACVAVTTSTAGSFQIRKNSSNVATISSSNANTGPQVGKTQIQCNAGDTIDVNSTLATAFDSAADTFISISRISGPAQIAATDTVAARYYASSTSVSGTPAAITYTTKDYDTHGAYSGSTFTCPVAGKYQVNAGIIIAATFNGLQPVLIYIYKNGSQIAQGRSVPSTAATSDWAGLSDVINCNAGDTIQIYGASTGTTPTISADNALNKVSIIRVGI